MSYITYFVDNEKGGEYVKIWMEKKLTYYIENGKEKKVYNGKGKKDEKIFKKCKQCKCKKLLKNFYENLKRKEKTYYRTICKKCISQKL